MTDTAKTIVEWTYQPTDFFEYSITLDYNGGVLEIGEGSVHGTFDEACFDQRDDFSKAVNEFLESTFLAQQVLHPQRYILAQPTLARLHPDGRRDISISLNGAVMVMPVGSVDLVVRDANGNITSDTNAERIAMHSQFREIIGRILPNDVALKKMLQSFRNALEDQDNLLIHLYEIRETLAAEFANAKEVRAALGVSSVDWSEFGRLANDEPLCEGRHRGKRLSLRKATQEEACWALEFSQRLIERYVQTRT